MFRNKVLEIRLDLIEGKEKNLREIITAQNNVIFNLDKKLNYAIQRIYILENYRKELGTFLDKVLKATGYEYKFTPTKLADYEIIKTKK